MSAFTDVILEEKEGRALCFRSKLMIYEESLLDGMYVTSAVNATGYPMASNCLPHPPRLEKDRFARPQAFSFEIDGEELGWDWEWAGYDCEETDSGRHAVVHLTHKTADISVDIHTKLDGTQVLERWLTIKNTADRPRRLSHLDIMSGGLQSVSKWEQYTQAPEKMYRLGYMEQSHWGHEGAFRWHDLPAAPYAVAGRYRRDRHRHPMFVLENRATGEVLIAQLAFSGGYQFEFDLNAERDDRCDLSYAVKIDGPAPLRVIEAGASFDTPHVHLGILFGNLDDAINEMHAHLRKSVLMCPADGKYCWIQAGIEPEFDMSRESTLEAVDSAAMLGVETVIVDAGWYVPPKQESSEWWNLAGDWYEDRNRYPNGIAEIRDYVHSKGMKFGMWMDAERIGPKTKVWQEHPEFVARVYTGEKSSATVVNMANPEAAAWVEGQISRVIEEYGCDVFRLDYNVGWPGIPLTRGERAGLEENNELRYYENVYAMYARLHAKFPNVVFENCAGGGGRTDVGMVASFNHTWVTDWQLAPRSFAITNGMTMALPPERMNRLMGGQTSYLSGSLDFQMRLLMFVQHTITIATPNGARVNSDQLAFMKHSIDLYKNFVRPFLPEALVYHHTPECFEPYPTGMGILETTAPDHSRGILGVFRLSMTGGEEATVCLRGVSRAKKYRVTFDNSGESCVVSGYELANAGVRVRLGSALTSELVLYEEC